jgi:quercetin dioxygenase-like cupin family protein
MASPFVLRAADVATYSPANHTGTANQRIIGKETVGARRVEVLLGTITRGHGALPHAHPNLEQASYLLAGEGVGELPGHRRTLRAGDWSFNAVGMFHRFEVVSEEPVQVMVVYAPPYSENPNAAVVADGIDDPRLQDGAGDVRDVPTDAPPIDLDFYVGARVSPAISHQTVGARFLDIYMVQLAADGYVAPHALQDAEQVLFVRSGKLDGQIGDQPFRAIAGDWVFVPENHVLRIAAGGAPSAFIVIRAHDAVT